ncbi:MAG: hypothetical protein IKH34_04050 [Oscillospiraceae bacterium]|nr:hypothetical protein [Oscillospiraceae bacterium]
MFYPKLKSRKKSRQTVDRFPGYVRKLRGPEGACWDMQNLSGEDYPLLETRRPRGLVGTLTNPGGLLEKDAPCWVSGGTLYVNGLATSVTGLAAGEKQLVSMGAYVLIFPDKVYYNTADPTDTGSMEASYRALGTVSYTPCDIDGNPYTVGSTGAAEPADPANGMIWVDTSEGGTVFREWSQVEFMWVSIETVYTRISFPSRGQLPQLFRQYDGVTISGSQIEELNGEKILYAVGGDENTDDYAVVVGLLSAAQSDEQQDLKIERKLPKMDYVCECQNRLWGCFYGSDGGKTLNEIYASALGDFRNFRQYLGLSTDSWTASVGSDGPWTGAVNYLGSPCFFKENRIHRVSVSAQGAHRLEETVCRGVQKGSARSLCVVGETLLYKSPVEVCAWQGGFPRSVSQALGDGVYDRASAGAFGEKYYLSMRDAAGAWHLFVYDLAKGLWHREDSLQALGFARCGESLYCIDAAAGKLWDLRGAAGSREDSIDWMAESGILDYRLPERKYLGRCSFTLWLDRGAELAAWIEYDSSGDWIECGRIENAGRGTRTLPIRPRRCDHLRIRLTGRGAVKLFSVTRTLEVGSDG